MLIISTFPLLLPDSGYIWMRLEAVSVIKGIIGHDWLRLADLLVSAYRLLYGLFSHMSVGWEPQ